MLDADSVFDRLLREAANLVPKMSTPKLTNALKVTSQLQQRITETVASRIQQEKDGVNVGNTLTSFRFESQACSASSSANLQITGLLDSNFKSADYSPKADEKDCGAVQSDLKLNHLDITHASMVDLEYSDDIVLLDSDSGPNSAKTEAAPGVHDQPFIGFSSESSTLSSLPLMTMVSNAQDSGRYGTILLPIVSSGRTTATFPRSSDSSSDHLAVTADSSAPDNQRLREDGTVNFDDVLFSEKTDSAAQNTQLKATNSSPMLNAHSPAAPDAVGMKPEPAESLSVSIRSSGAPAGAFSNLATMTSFTPLQLSSSTSSNVRLANSSVNVNPLLVVEAPSQPSFDAATSSKLSHGTGPYRCRDCDKEFRILRYLEKHRRIHTGEKPYQCCYCGRQFNDWPNMNRHKRIHTGERPYRCSVCAKTFSQPAVYNEHVKRHTGERPYICMVCAKGFPRAARLSVHMRVHTGERPYPCTSCDRRFSQPHHLAAHLRIHSGDRPYSCPKCDVSFACISNLRRHRKQVHASSPMTDEENDFKNAPEKKPALQRLAAVLPVTETSLSGSSSLIESSLSTMSNAFGSESSVALAAAMSAGTLLTATGALVPAGLLSASSIPGLILTSGHPGAILAASHPFSDQQQQQQQHLQPALLTHGAALGDTTGSAFLSTSGPTAIPVSLTHATVSTSSTQDSLLKSVPSSTVSLMIPPMLSSSGNPENLRQATVTFLTPTGELDRSCLTGATLTAGTHDGGFIVNSAGGETVYLEPLDPRMTLEPGQQFTLATIPTSLSQGTTTILGPSNSGTHLFGHPIQLQPGSHATHIAFATNFSGQSHLLAPTSSVFSAQAVPAHASMYAGQGSPAILFTSPMNSHSITTTGSTELSRQPSGDQSHSRVTAVSCLQNPLPNRNSGHDVTVSRPSSTQNNQQTTLLVPVVNSTVDLCSAISTAGLDCVSTACVMHGSNWPAVFTTPSGAHPSPETGNFEEHAESVVFITSRPSSVLSTSSVGAVTTTSVNENL